MAVTITDRGSATGTSVSSVASSSFTPAAGSMLIVAVVCQTVGVSSVSGHAGGAAWVKIGDFQNWSTANRDFELWASFTGGSPSAGAVTVSFGGTTGGANCYFVEVAGFDSSGSVANAFGVTNQVGGYDLRAETLTLSAFANSGNMTFAVGAKSGAVAITWNDGTFTTLTSTVGGGFVQQIAYLATEDSTIAVTYPNSTHNMLYGVEIKASGGGGGEVAGTPMQSLSAGFGPALAARLNGVLQ